MVERLADRVAIVTGGAKGIGKEYAKALALEGATVVLADIVDGKDVVADIQAAKPDARVYNMPTDVSSEESVRSMVERTVALTGKIDIVVNNAALFATLPPVFITDIDQELWDRVMAINVRGPFLVAKHVVPHMMARKYGKIINISSGTAYKGMIEMLHYVTSKGAIVSFTRALSRDLGKHGICVNTLAPGLVMSESVIEHQDYREGTHAAVVNSRAFKRDQYPTDLLGGLIFLASSESDFMTGQTLAIDGGSINT
jgi:NAD(P)-dependent dehydrogenase (short-subunit alcohol dehydrogenase family)